MIHPDDNALQLMLRVIEMAPETEKAELGRMKTLLGAGLRIGKYHENVPEAYRGVGYREGISVLPDKVGWKLAQDINKAKSLKEVRTLWDAASLADKHAMAEKHFMRVQQLEAVVRSTEKGHPFYKRYPTSTGTGSSEVRTLKGFKNYLALAYGYPKDHPSYAEPKLIFDYSQKGWPDPRGAVTTGRFGPHEEMIGRLREMKDTVKPGAARRVSRVGALKEYFAGIGELEGFGAKDKADLERMMRNPKFTDEMSERRRLSGMMKQAWRTHVDPNTRPAFFGPGRMFSARSYPSYHFKLLDAFKKLGKARGLAPLAMLAMMIPHVLGGED